MQNIIYPFSDYWTVYVFFIFLVTLVLFLDLGFFHKKEHTMTWKESVIWSIFWVGLALVFNYGLYRYTAFKLSNDSDFLMIPGSNAMQQAKQTALEFLTGFLLEKILSIDNIFVFVMVFRLFSIPDNFQHKILFYGILGAFLFRAIFIGLGSLVLKYKFMLIIFGIFLILIGLKSLFIKEKPIDANDNKVLKFLSCFFKIKHQVDKPVFFIKEQGVLYVTPLFIALMMIECADVVFAIDSVPAIFAITKEPLIVFTSNIFAILGVRAIYFLILPIMDYFYYIKYGLGIILVFIGSKMIWLNDYFGGHFPVSWSLSFIIGTILICISLSLLWPQQKKE